MKTFKTLNYSQKNDIKGFKIQVAQEFIHLYLNHNKKNGFLGFIVSVNSILHLYSLYVETDDLQQLKVYKFSQDRLELFFGSIRTRDGHNNNPTVREFRSAYRKLVNRIN